MSTELIASQGDGEFEELAAGTVFAGYRVLGLLGRGGRGAVYLAESCTLIEKVAIKILHRGSDARIIELFQKEAKVCALLKDEHIARFKTYGIESNCCYLVMEYVEGESLDKYIETRGVLTPSAFLTIFRGVVAGLVYAHSMQILHRDVKPANILILNVDGADGSDGSVKLVDFGLAKELDAGRDEQSTTSGVLRGSPAYMSPEQCRGEALDVRSDVYSLGCTMYQAVTGKPPFEAETPFSVMAMHLHNEPRFPENVKVNPDLKRLILSCLAKNPDERIQSMLEIKKLLSGWDTSRMSVVVQSGGTSFHRIGLAGVCLLVLVSVVLLAFKVQKLGAVPSEVTAKQTTKHVSPQPLALSRATAGELLELSRMHYQERFSDDLLSLVTAACRKADATNDIAIRVACHLEMLDLMRRRQDQAAEIREVEVIRSLLSMNARLPFSLEYRATRELAYTLSLEGHHKEALTIYKKIFDKIKDSTGATELDWKHETLESLGWESSELRDFDSAIRYATESIAYGNEEQRGVRRIQVVRYAALSGNARRFETAFAGLDLNSNSLRSERGGSNLGQLGRILVDSKRISEGKRCLEKALEILAEGRQKWPLESTSFFMSLAWVAKLEGNIKEALRLNGLARAEIGRQDSVPRTPSEVLRDEEFKQRVARQRQLIEAE
ncbi:MAG: serine/threonine protein kinase [Candidatus Obscuribacterales bacterium]|nr:serine/threonine protein kinase [Candidatus Obscuribacterales bacterium]